ncbi:MAG: site-specific integrase [Clostridiales bacterium]|jgi:integrase|nr:site-specific integrase [Mediterraneibacter faecis]MBS5312388.1 site-specific integrase [Clostridiales bacterium]RGF69979.1 site-specific integrase [Ruminococcus sp. AF32-2AC]RGF96162.1 site-specific integrase [Ruminococcus sp. AM49-8]RGF98685.1 site-specific integrase [Ruminococcus sp. AM49-10BH]RGH42310.1 site-specific integrase [Ruminococcus sp. AM41-2AC]RGI45071.1 site-specific integrase [Ruminococcus sp. OM04-4AA]
MDMEVYLSRGRTLKYQITVCEQVPADSEIYQIEKGNAGDNKGNEIILSTCSAKANIRIVLYRIMRRYIEMEHIRPKDYIFKGKDGGAYRGTTFRQEFQQYCDKNEIVDGSYIFKTHDYRHTLATQFYDEDVSIQTIRDYLGHFSEEMTKQYVDFMPRRIEKASDTYFKKSENDLASTIKVKKRGDRK